ncbi:MAG: IS256 family transposase [Candidatus Dormibacteria bacterium]
MAHPRMTDQELFDQLALADRDQLRLILEHGIQRLIELEASAVIGADPYERAADRATHRNGHRPKPLDTGMGRLELQIPKLRMGSFFPTLLEPRRRIDRALLAVIQEAYVQGISTRKVDALMEALGGCQISKSEVSRICALLDEELAAFRERPLDDAAYPYVWFDATHHKVRQAGRIVSQATVIAVGVRETGEKSVLGLMSGAAETEAFWLEFCRSLIRRGLGGIQLVISDAHEGLRSALAQCFAGTTWQRCRVHFLRNIGAAVPATHAPAVLALTRTIFSQPTSETAHEAVSHALQLLEPRFSKAAELLRKAEADVLAYMAFPADHWRSISSTNAIERLNAEIDRRAKVVGIFPNTASLLRLATAVVQDQHDEWQDDRRLFSHHSMGLLLHPEGPPLLTNTLTEGFAA